MSVGVAFPSLILIVIHLMIYEKVRLESVRKSIRKLKVDLSQKRLTTYSNFLLRIVIWNIYLGEVKILQYLLTPLQPIKIQTIFFQIMNVTYQRTILILERNRVYLFQY